MSKYSLWILIAVSACSSLAGCHRTGKEILNPALQAEVTKLKAVRDPISKEIFQFRLWVRQPYNNRRFTELEKTAQELRVSRQIFDNGSWKIVQFYDALECREDEPESMWELHDRIHREWIAAYPASITARVAYADFLISYGWHARGSGYAREVTKEGGRLFEDRLNQASKVIEVARAMPQQDPFCLRVLFTLALGQGWPMKDQDALVREGHEAEPTFWGYDVAHANALLPRWYGKEGDWEAFATATSARPEGLGEELYARIVMDLEGYYENLFRESKASWPETNAGLEQLQKKYPRWNALTHYTALLASLANDRAVAKKAFDRLGDNYDAGIWRTPERFVRLRHWALTGTGSVHDH